MRAKKQNLTSFYDAKQQIESYMLWYNDRRRHREIGRITPNQKWAQAQWWSSDKQPGIGSAKTLSRPDDSLKNQNNNQPLGTSLDKAWADPYFGLLDDQRGENPQNQIENSAQSLGAKTAYHRSS